MITVHLLVYTIGFGAPWPQRTEEDDTWGCGKVGKTHCRDLLLLSRVEANENNHIQGVRLKSDIVDSSFHIILLSIAIVFFFNYICRNVHCITYEITLVRGDNPCPVLYRSSSTVTSLLCYLAEGICLLAIVLILIEWSRQPGWKSLSRPSPVGWGNDGVRTFTPHWRHCYGRSRFSRRCLFHIL